VSPERVVIPPVRIAPPVVRVGWGDIVVITSFFPEIEVDNSKEGIWIFSLINGSGPHANKFTC